MSKLRCHQYEDEPDQFEIVEAECRVVFWLQGKMTFLLSK